MLLVDVEIPRIGCIETGEDAILVTAQLVRFAELDFAVAVLAEDALVADVAEFLVPTDGTPEVVEYRLVVSINRFQAHCPPDYGRVFALASSRVLSA